MKKTSSKNHVQPSDKNPLEWAIFAVSCLLIAGVLAVLGREAVRFEGGPARLETAFGAVEREGDFWKVPVTIHNRGDQVAQNVEAEVTEGEAEEGRTATLRMDYVPRGSEKKGWALFYGEAKPTKIRVKAIGFEES